MIQAANCKLPDIIIIIIILLAKNDDIYVIQLTCCFETNRRKAEDIRWKNIKILRTTVTGFYKNLKKIFIERTTLGLITHNIKEIYRLFQETNITVSRMINKCIEVVTRASFCIYVHRNKA